MNNNKDNKDDFFFRDDFEVTLEEDLEEIQADTEAVKKDVLKRVQELFGSEFIYQVAFSDVKWS